MTIASEITALQTNLTNAKSAVTTKGGTVGDTGLAGLASEIMSIPSGSGAEDWGTVTYLDSNNVEQTLDVQNIVEYMSFGGLNANISAYATASGVTISRDTITGFRFGTSAIFTPTQFLVCPYSGAKLTSLSGLENLVFLSDYFLQGQNQFNQLLSFPNIEVIGGYFLSGCTIFNQPINFGKKVNIGNYFLYNCVSFNNTIDYANIEKIGDGFLTSCTSYNQPVDLSSFTTTPNSFLDRCTSFNQPLDLTGITTVGSYFLTQCTGFDNTIDLTGVTKIGQYFLNGCTSYTKPLTMPSSLSGTNAVSSYFMYNCKNFVGPLVCEGPSSNSYLQSNNYILATNDATAPMYTTGITLTGTRKQIWKNRYADRTSSPYRKLILGS